MKKVKGTLIILLSLFIICTLIAIVFVMIYLFPLKWSLDLAGFKYFISQFDDFKGLFAGNIVLISVYYWMLQITNLNNSNTRLKTEIKERKRQNSVEETRKYFTHTEVKISDFISHINNFGVQLFGYNWNTSEFSYNSLTQQNFPWVQTYQNMERNHGSQSKFLNEITNEFESVSAIILHGDLDQKLMNNLMGKSFISRIETLYPFIAYIKNNDDSLGLKTIELYEKWKG